MNELGRYIRNHRLDSAMTQEEFSYKIKVTNVTMSHLENGQRVGAKTLKKLSVYLKLPTKALRRMMLNEDN